MRGDFSNWLGWQMRGYFSNGPGQQKRNEFFNGPGQAGKREISFSMGWAGPAKENCFFQLSGRFTKKEDNNYCASAQADKRKTKFTNRLADKKLLKNLI